MKLKKSTWFARIGPLHTLVPANIKGFLFTFSTIVLGIFSANHPLPFDSHSETDGVGAAFFITLVIFYLIVGYLKSERF